MDKGTRKMTPEEEKEFWGDFNSLGVVAPPKEDKE